MLVTGREVGLLFFWGYFSNIYIVVRGCVNRIILLLCLKLFSGFSLILGVVFNLVF